MRQLIGLALLLLVPASTAKAPEGPSIIEAKQVLLDQDQPERRDFGALTLVGSWQLVANSLSFGGISSMRIDDENHVTAISDRGSIIRFRVNHLGSHWPATIRAVPAGPGPKAGFGIFDRDIESMAYDPASGQTWLGFEFWNTIWRYDPTLKSANGKRARPAAMSKWPLNEGAETMVRLLDGRFLIISENVRREKNGRDEARGLLFDRDPLTHPPAPLRFRYAPPPGFLATDGAQLPDGRVLLLNRHFSLYDGVGAAVTLIDPRDIRHGQTLVPRIVAWLQPPLNIDNMEAIAVNRKEGRTHVWIASDDNFSLLQQTLLIEFELDLPEAETRRTR